MPPRAADTNEPLTYVGAAVGAGSSGTGGANGASGVPALVISTGGPAMDGPVSRSVPNAKAPAAPAAALTPSRIIARRLSFLAWHAGHHAIGCWRTVGRRLGNASKSVGGPTSCVKA